MNQTNRFKKLMAASGQYEAAIDELWTCIQERRYSALLGPHYAGKSRILEHILKRVKKERALVGDQGQPQPGEPGGQHPVPRPAGGPDLARDCPDQAGPALEIDQPQKHDRWRFPGVHRNPAAADQAQHCPGAGPPGNASPGYPAKSIDPRCGPSIWPSSRSPII